MATEAENLIGEGLHEQSTAETEISVTSETQGAVETKPVNIAMETEKGTDINKVQEQLHEEVRMLKDKLKQTEQTVVKTQANLRLQQTRTKQLISIWKTHVERNEQNLKRQGMVRDQQLGEVISQLLFFEGQLRKEQKRILSLLADKDKIIEQQDKHILDLQVQNSKLLEALEDVKNMSNKNGIIQGVFMSQGQGNGYATGADNSAFSFDISIPADIVPSHKAPQKSGGRFNAVKDRLRRHKSNLELRNIENTIFEETAEELSLSQENVVCRRSNPRRTSRERCKSIAGYPVSTDRGLEDCDLSTSQLDNEISLYEKELDRVADANNSNSDYSDTSSYSASSHLGFDESENLSDSNKLETSAQSMLNVSDLSDYDLKKMSGKDRVRSVSSSDVRMTSNSTKDPLKSGKTDSQKSVQAEGKSSPISEYNPFKSFKSMLKRRGSKQKKKRAVSLQQTTNMEYYEALKYHLDKDSKSKKGH